MRYELLNYRKRLTETQSSVVGSFDKIMNSESLHILDTWELLRCGVNRPYVVAFKI